MKDETTAPPGIRRLHTTAWRQVRAHYADTIRWIAEAPASWMGIPTWAKWFRRVSAVRGRHDLSVIPPAREHGHE